MLGTRGHVAPPLSGGVRALGARYSPILKGTCNDKYRFVRLGQYTSHRVKSLGSEAQEGGEGRSAQGGDSTKGDATGLDQGGERPASRPTGRVITGNEKQRLPVQGMKLERVERLGQESWAGVASVDRGEQGIGYKNIAALVAGDAAMLVVFASIGRISHGETLAVTDSLATALPFMIGWFTACGALGGYKRQALESAIKTAGLCWATGIPAGLLVRTITKGYIPETAFVIVSMAATGVFLIGWRAAYSALVGPLDSSLTPGEQLKRRKNKRGNPFEFVSLLISLVKRW